MGASARQELCWPLHYFRDKKRTSPSPFSRPTASTVKANLPTTQIDTYSLTHCPPRKWIVALYLNNEGFKGHRVALLSSFLCFSKLPAKVVLTSSVYAAFKTWLFRTVVTPANTIDVTRVVTQPFKGAYVALNDASSLRFDGKRDTSCLLFPVKNKNKSDVNAEFCDFP